MKLCHLFLYRLHTHDTYEVKSPTDSCARKMEEFRDRLKQSFPQQKATDLWQAFEADAKPV